jgi:hypothetical protein
MRNVDQGMDGRRRRKQRVCGNLHHVHFSHGDFLLDAERDDVD